jgi:hypothetical protein
MVAWVVREHGLWNERAAALLGSRSAVQLAAYGNAAEARQMPPASEHLPPTRTSSPARRTPTPRFSVPIGTNDKKPAYSRPRDHRSPLIYLFCPTILVALSKKLAEDDVGLQLASDLVNRFNPLLLWIRGRQLGLTGAAPPCSHRWRILIQLLFLN